MERKLKNRLKIKKHGPWTTKFSIEDKLEIRLKINSFFMLVLGP